MHDWTISDFDYHMIYAGVPGTMHINASGYWTGGTKSRVFSTIDGPQLDEGEPSTLDISKISLIFTREGDNAESEVDYWALPEDARQDLYDIMYDAASGLIQRCGTIPVVLNGERKKKLDWF